MDPFIFFRWLHILAGAAWFGEVMTINFVVIPNLKSMDSAARPHFIRNIFPRLFRLASFLALVSISSGLINSYLLSGWRDPARLISTRWGISILLGGSLAIGLALFHFFVERQIEPIASSMNEETSEIEVENVMKFLGLVPRLGLIVMILIFILMMYAARGV